MLRRTGLIALVAAGAQAQNCWVCTENTPITELTASNGKCYFTSVLDAGDGTGDGDSAEFVDCAGGYCYTKYTSKDGILQSVARGCLAAGSTDTSTATGFNFLFDTDVTSVDDLSGSQQMCSVDTTQESQVLFQANQDLNELTDVECAKICDADSITTANSACNNDEVQTLSDCNGQCKDTAVCTCDHWTGEITHICGSTKDAYGRATERPVLVNGVYECQEYTCTSCTYQTDPADATTITDVANADCYGDGSVGSTGTCRCTSAGTLQAGTTLYTGGSFLNTDTNSCDPIACDPTCSITGQQCYHSLHGNAGSCQCPSGQQLNSDNTACETPVVETSNPMCIQCSSDIDSGSSCATGTMAATECASATAKCAAVSTIWVDINGNSIREVVERGCTEDAVVTDQCEFQAISGTPVAAQSSGFTNVDTTEVSCRYVCEGNGCNSDLADGISDYVATRSCNVLDSCSGIEACKTVSAVPDLSAASQSCGNINGREAFCVGHMTYLEHERYDGSIERALTKLEYRCEAAEDNLSETMQTCGEPTTIGFSNPSFASEAQSANGLSGVRQVINMYNCMTVCDSNNCNMAWPGQPQCITCSSADLEADGTTLKSVADPDYCYTNVAMPAACTNYYDNVCLVKQSGLDLTSNWAQKSMNPYSAMQSMGAYKSIMRGCGVGSVSMDSDGSVMTRDDSQNQYSYMDRQVVCSENGCNFGPALPTPEN